jgi:hypothetical protein
LHTQPRNDTDIYNYKSSFPSSLNPADIKNGNGERERRIKLQNLYLKDSFNDGTHQAATFTSHNDDDWLTQKLPESGAGTESTRRGNGLVVDESGALLLVPLAGILALNIMDSIVLAGHDFGREVFGLGAAVGVISE